MGEKFAWKCTQASFTRGEPVAPCLFASPRPDYGLGAKSETRTVDRMGLSFHNVSRGRGITRHCHILRDKM